MSADIFQQVSPGQSVDTSAATWNRVLRSVAYIEKIQATAFAGGLSAGNDFARCLVRNDSGADVSQFGVLGITSVINSPSDNLKDFKDEGFAFKAEKPSGKSPEMFCVTLQPIFNGEIGRCQLIGIAPVRLVGSSKIKVAGPIGDDTGKLSTQRFGSAAILYDEGDGGNPASERWGVVLLGGATGLRLQGVLDENLDSPSNGWTGATTATISIWVPKESESKADDYWTSPRDFEDSNVNIEIVNRDPSLEGDVGAYVKIEWIDGEFSPYWVGC